MTSLLLALSAHAFAGGHAVFVIAAPASADSTRQTTAYAGLAWTLGGNKPGLRPDLTVGVRSVKTSSNDQVSAGADLSARFSLTTGMPLNSARLSYVFGSRDLLGNAGIGYSYASKSFMSTLAAQGPYSRASVDYEFANRRLVPSLELLTIGKPRKPVDRGLFTCDMHGWVLPQNPSLGDQCLPPG